VLPRPFARRPVFLTPNAVRGRRRQRALANLATLVGAVVLARGVDDALSEEPLDAALAAAPA
jgi:TetR/AcrR family transcriptional repressor of nem operon